jgi:hypothetical protein
VNLYVKVDAFLYEENFSFRSRIFKEPGLFKGKWQETRTVKDTENVFETVVLGRTFVTLHNAFYRLKITLLGPKLVFKGVLVKENPRKL